MGGKHEGKGRRDGSSFTTQRAKSLVDGEQPSKPPQAGQEGRGHASTVRDQDNITRDTRKRPMRFAESGWQHQRRQRRRDRCQARVLAPPAVRRPHREVGEVGGRRVLRRSRRGSSAFIVHVLAEARLESQIGWAPGVAAAVWYCEPPCVDGMDRQEFWGRGGQSAPI